VQHLIEGIVKKAEAMACKHEREQVRKHLRANDSLLIISVPGAARHKFNLNCYQSNATDKTRGDILPMVLSVVIAT
jgi:hypothetical protein